MAKGVKTRSHTTWFINVNFLVGGKGCGSLNDFIMKHLENLFYFPYKKLEYANLIVLFDKVQYSKSLVYSFICDFWRHLNLGPFNLGIFLAFQMAIMHGQSPIFFVFYFFIYLDHLILHLELHCLSFAMWGADVLIEWLSPSHYLYLMLQAFSISYI